MAITFFGVASTPIDNGAQAGPTATITPPTSMQAGDLVVVFGQYRGNGAGPTGIIRNFNTLNVASEHGGQRWSTVTPSNDALVHLRCFHCRFNGTWSANPSWTVDTGVEALTLVMLVFRPTTTSKWWVPNIGPKIGTFAAGVTPFTKTITGIITLTKHGSQSHASIAAWASQDNNTWGTLSGTGWSKTGLAAQYRNITGQDQSLTFAYNIQSASGGSNNVSQNQATVGGDAGATMILAFTEIDLPSAGIGGALGSPAVQSAQGKSQAVGTTISAVGNAIAWGNSVVGHVSTEAPLAGGMVHDISDDKGNEYIILQRLDSENLLDQFLDFWRPNITNGPTTITATHDGGDSVLRAIQWHEMLGGVEIDNYGGRKWQGQDSFSAETFSAFPTVTPSIANTYSFGAVAAFTSGNVDFYTPNAPWNERNIIEGGSADLPMSTFDFLQGAPAAVTFSTLADAGAEAGMMFVIFKPAPGQLISIMPVQSYVAGTNSLVATPISVGLTSLAIRGWRNAWTDTGADVITVKVEISFDAGINWGTLVGFTARGGNILNRSGQQITHSLAQIALPQPGNSLRQIRATITNNVTLPTNVVASLT